jgi:hypothetical protein
MTTGPAVRHSSRYLTIREEVAMKRNVVRGLVVALFAACGSPAEPGLRVERQVGVIGESGASLLVIPERAAAGTPVAIIVHTFGSGCVREADTETLVSGMLADITPYDSFTVSMPSSMACTMRLYAFPHETTVAFASRGVATVRVHGRLDNGAPITVTRTIVIE